MTVISEEEYNKSLKGKVGLRKTDKKLFGPGKFALRLIGEFEAMLVYKEQRRTRQNIFFIKGQQQAFLGLPDDIRALELIKRIGKISQKDIKLSFPKLFVGIGEMKTEPYKIELN